MLFFSSRAQIEKISASLGIKYFYTFSRSESIPYVCVLDKRVKKLVTLGQKVNQARKSKHGSKMIVKIDKA